MKKATFWAATYLVFAATSLVTQVIFDHEVYFTFFALLTSTIWQAAGYIKGDE